MRNKRLATDSKSVLAVSYTMNTIYSHFSFQWLQLWRQILQSSHTVNPWQPTENTEALIWNALALWK